jgi:hypothetical protein
MAMASGASELLAEPGMASAEWSRRGGAAVPYPPLAEMSDAQRGEFPGGVA